MRDVKPAPTKTAGKPGARTRRMLVIGTARPVVRVYGIPQGTSEQTLEKLAPDIRCMVGIDPIEVRDVSVFFPTDLLMAGLGEEVVALVSGLSPALGGWHLASTIVDRVTKLLARYFPASKIIIIAPLTVEVVGFLPPQDAKT